MDHSGPVLTWNLFLTLFLVPFCVTLLFFAIKRLFIQRDADVAKIAALLAEKQFMKDESLDVWRVGFTALLSQVKERVDTIAEELHNKVSISDCKEHEKEIRENMKDFDRRLRSSKGDNPL